MIIAENELHFTRQQIKKLTPYLNDIHWNRGNGYTAKRGAEGTKVFLKDKQRAACWYYVYNEHNKTHAYIRAYYGEYNPLTGRIEINEEKLARDKNKTKNPGKMMTVYAYQLFRKEYIKKAVELISKHLTDEIKTEVKQSIVEQLYIQTTYDPAWFYRIDGSPKFTKWEEIPPKHRCCVESLEERRWGKDGDSSTTILRLVDRNQARAQLIKMCPDLLQPQETTIVHKTIDEEGKKKGINSSLDLSTLSDEELKARYETLQQKLSGNNME